MKDICTQETSRDFRQRYEGTIGALIKDSGEREYIWINEVNQERVIFSNKSGTSFESVNGHGTEFEFTQVPMGWYNTATGPLFFCRRPQRQWQRGISAGNTRIQNKDLSIVDVTLARVQSALSFTGEFKKWPWALNKFFCIANDNVMFNDIIIGTMKDDVLTIEKDHEDVLQELQDTLRRGGWKLSATIKET